jgi:two-component system LytT family response regulator
MKARIVIADDEPLPRRRNARLLKERDDVEVVAQCSGGDEAIAAIREHNPDLVLLDIQMPDVDGFGVISEVGTDRMPYVIFITAYDQHAIKAFEVNAVDYLVKPYTTERFQDSIDRALKRLAERDGKDDGSRLESILQRVFSDESRGDHSASDKILVRDRDRTRLVRARDIDWVESEANYVRLHVGPASYLIRGNLGRFEEKLTPFGFARVHRRFLVNVDRVTEVQPWFGGDAVLVLANNTKVRLSRTFKETFEKRFLQP